MLLVSNFFVEYNLNMVRWIISFWSSEGNPSSPGDLLLLVFLMAPLISSSLISHDHLSLRFEYKLNESGLWSCKNSSSSSVAVSLKYSCNSTAAL